MNETENLSKFFQEDAVLIRHSLGMVVESYVDGYSDDEFSDDSDGEPLALGSVKVALYPSGKESVFKEAEVWLAYTQKGWFHFKYISSNSHHV